MPNVLIVRYRAAVAAATTARLCMAGDHLRRLYMAGDHYRARFTPECRTVGHAKLPATHRCRPQGQRGAVVVLEGARKDPLT